MENGAIDGVELQMGTFSGHGTSQDSDLRHSHKSRAERNKKLQKQLKSEQWATVTSPALMGQLAG